MAVRKEELDRVQAPVLVVWRREATAASRRRMRARRRRALSWLASVLVLAAVLGGDRTRGSTPASRADSPRSVVLQEGQSLWDAVGRFAASGVDRRAYVDAVIRLNGVASPPPAGARIELPR